MTGHTGKGKANSHIENGPKSQKTGPRELTSKQFPGTGNINRLVISESHSCDPVIPFLILHLSIGFQALGDDSFIGCEISLVYGNKHFF